MSTVTTAIKPTTEATGLVTADRACCCPARPMVMVIIPPAAGRPHSTDLLLCGHHYRASAAALNAIGAAVLDFRPQSRP
jgi:hypothetical protein